MESRKERLDLELELLQKGQWDFRDVMKYYRIGKNKAYDVIRLARKNGGAVVGNDMMVAYTKAIIQLHDGSTPYDEIVKRGAERKFL